MRRNKEANNITKDVNTSKMTILIKPFIIKEEVLNGKRNNS